MVECSADCSSYPPPPSLHISPHISLSFSVFLSFKYLLHQLLQLKMHLLGFTPNHWYTLLTNYVCKWQNNHNKTSKPRHLCLIINSNCDRSISNEFSSRHLKCDHPTCPATCPHVSDTAMTRQIVSPPAPLPLSPSTGLLTYIQTRPRWHTINLKPCWHYFFVTALKYSLLHFSPEVQSSVQLYNYC